MAIHFNNPETIAIQENAFCESNNGIDAIPEGNIISSTAISGIEKRMLSPFVRNNKTWKIWPFAGKAKLYCLTMVISDMANQLSGTMDLNSFEGVGKNEYLPLNKTIYYWQNAVDSSSSPNQVHVMSAIIKSKGRLRDVGSVFMNVKEDAEYKGLLDELSSMVADAASFSVITNIALKFAGVVGQYLGKVHDQPIGTVVRSFTRLHGDWDKTGIIPVEVGTQNVDFSFELIVRDNKRRSQNGNSRPFEVPDISKRDYCMISM